jgi:hypothetical protein
VAVPRTSDATLRLQDCSLVEDLGATCAEPGITDSRKVFHSFRHGFKDGARAVMPEEHHDAITGHSNGSVGRSYGQGVPLRVLAESMAKVSFEGV